MTRRARQSRAQFLSTMFFRLKKSSQMLARGETHSGLTSAVEAKQWQTILTHIEWQLQLPDDYGATKTDAARREHISAIESLVARQDAQKETVQRANPTHSELRLLLMGLANQLVALARSADDGRNPTPAPLKKSISLEVRAAFDALFQTCERLEVVAQQGVDPARLQLELAQEAANLRQLLDATEEAAAEMARLTLSAGRWKVADSSDKFEKLGWAARELTQINRELEE